MPRGIPNNPKKGKAKTKRTITAGKRNPIKRGKVNKTKARNKK